MEKNMQFQLDELILDAEIAVDKAKCMAETVTDSYFSEAQPNTLSLATEYERNSTYMFILQDCLTECKKAILALQNAADAVMN